MNEDPMIGKKTPGFCLPDSREKKVCIKDLAGKWVVLYFYPRDNTSACTKEAVAFSGELEEFSTMNAEIVGVSPDSAASHEKFIESRELKIPLLSDTSHETLEKYGVWKKKRMYGREFMGVERSTFLIDPEGTVRAVWRKVKVPGHVEEVKRTLQSVA